MPDALGSVRRMADPNAAATFALAYEPYGNVPEVAGEARTRYGFAGEWMDRTGLVHLRARYYAPYLGQIIGPDPFSGYSASPMTQNPYVYALNTPVLLTDPTGHNPAAAVAMAALVGAGVGFGIGVTVGGAYGYATYPWALSGECGCDAQQRALQMTRWEWAGAHALAGGVVGGVAGGIASIAPIGLIAVGGVGVVVSGADIIHTVDIIRNETGGMTWCLGTRLLLDVAGIALGTSGIAQGIRAWRASGSMLRWVAVPATLTGKAAPDDMYSRSRPGRG